MLITYKFAGFKEISRTGELALMENDFSAIQPPPPYVDLRVWGSGCRVAHTTVEKDLRMGH
jgi:hypothetical protein